MSCTLSLSWVEYATEAELFAIFDMFSESKIQPLRAQLEQRRSAIKTKRRHLDELANSLIAPYTELEKGAEEARGLIGDIGDMELELAKLRARRGVQSTGDEDEDSLPPRTNLTHAEACAYGETLVSSF